MRIIRVLQLLALLLLVGYLALLHHSNPQTVWLPFLRWLPISTVWVVVIALLLGFVGGWLSLSGRVFRLNRENRGLRQRLIKAGLEAELVSPPKRAPKRIRKPTPAEPPQL